MTTSNSAAAMRTAAVGLSPKIVVRSDMLERGSAEPPSSLLVLLELEDERSVVTLPELLPPAPGALTLPEALPPGTVTVPEALPLALGAAGALPEELDLSEGAGADDDELDDELAPGWA